ncbi:MAG: type II toxin-antitoxin system VapC family toxin [Fibrobacterota bacterium]|nr:type II toxin-antitoxin system VapC family toxin [Fibrobacterota bacterium]
MSDAAVLLDTHVWLWLADGNDRLKNTPGYEAILKARAMSGIFISIISVWEVGMLASKGRILARQDYRRWIERGLSESFVRLQPMTTGIALESSSLPGEFHADPADRILVATARELDIPLITADANILAYANRNHVKALEV